MQRNTNLEGKVRGWYDDEKIEDNAANEWCKVLSFYYFSPTLFVKSRIQISDLSEMTSEPSNENECILKTFLLLKKEVWIERPNPVNLSRKTN